MAIDDNTRAWYEDAVSKSSKISKAVTDSKTSKGAFDSNLGTDLTPPDTSLPTATLTAPEIGSGFDGTAQDSAPLTAGPVTTPSALGTAQPVATPVEPTAPAAVAGPTTPVTGTQPMATGVKDSKGIKTQPVVPDADYTAPTMPDQSRSTQDITSGLGMASPVEEVTTEPVTTTTTIPGTPGTGDYGTTQDAWDAAVEAGDADPVWSSDFGAEQTATVETYDWGSFENYNGYDGAAAPIIGGKATTPSGAYFYDGTNLPAGTRANYYYGNLNDMQSAWNGQVDSMSDGSTTYQDALNAWINTGMQNGYSVRELDSMMGWEYGTTMTAFSTIQGLNDAQVHMMSGVNYPPENDVQRMWSDRVLEVVKDPNKDATKIVEQFVADAVAAGYSVDYIDYAGLFPPGSAQAVIDQYKSSSNRQLPEGYEVGEPGTPDTTTTTTTPGTTSLEGGASLNTGTNPMIPMADRTNIGAVNDGILANIARGTFFDDTDKVLEGYDNAALYNPEDAFMVSTRLNDLIAEDSDYMKLITARADADASARGISGSSIHTQAAAKAAIEGALPIAQGDVQVSMFNAGEYNDMMDKRQQLYGDVSLATQRGSFEYLENMQAQIGDLISADVKHQADELFSTFEHKQDLETAKNLFEHEQTVNNMKYAADLYSSYNNTVGLINQSDMDPQGKREAIANALANTVSAINVVKTVGMGLNINLDDFDLDYNIEDEAKYDNINYTADDYRMFPDTVLEGADAFMGRLGEETDGVDFSTIFKAADGTYTDKQLDWYSDLRYWQTYESMVRRDTPDGWTDAMNYYRRNGFNAETLSTMRSLVDSAWDTTSEGKAFLTYNGVTYDSYAEKTAAMTDSWVS